MAAILPFLVLLVLSAVLVGYERLKQRRLDYQQAATTNSSRRPVNLRVVTLVLQYVCMLDSRT